METFSALLGICAGNSPVSGEFPAQRPVTRSFDVFFDLRLNKRLSKQPWGWWFETPSRPLWRHRNEGRTQILSSFHEWCCHYNSNAMVNWLYCNSIVGNHIDAKFTMEKSFVKLFFKIWNRDSVTLTWRNELGEKHDYNDVTMGALPSQLTSNLTVYSMIYSDQHKRNIKAPRHLPFVRGIHRWPAKYRHKGPVTRKKPSIWWRHDVIKCKSPYAKFWSNILFGVVSVQNQKVVYQMRFGWQ